MPQIDGIITKGIGSFYYVEAAGEIYECRAKGIFRKDGIKPLTGDRVKISLNTNAENTIDVIKERTSLLTRPPVANIDKLFIVSSVVEPKPVFLIIDKLSAIAVDKGIEPVIVFTKCDMSSPDEYASVYRKIGMKTYCVSNETGEGVEELKKEFEGHVCALCGNSGVGKSSLLNSISPALELKTAKISDKLGRGKHTTRHSELFALCGGWVADTPGFASIVDENSEYIIKENLPFAFPEFEKYLGKCKFSTCRHVNDKGCLIVDAVNRGEIPESRHESYTMMLEQAEKIKEY